MDKHNLENLTKEAKNQLDQEKLGIETLMVLRWSIGYRDLIQKKMGIEDFNSIDGLTSECDFDFVPSKENFHQLSVERLSEIKAEVEEYFLIHDSLIRDLLRGISKLHQ